MGLQPRTPWWGQVVPIAALVLIATATGCGSDDKATSASGTLAAMGHVGVSPDGSTEIIVVVAEGGVAVPDAIITVNGVPVPLDPYGDGYYWTADLAVSPGDPVTLRVATSRNSLTQETSVPAALRISAPSDSAFFLDDQEIPVAWNNVPSVSGVKVNYYEDDVYPLCFAELPTGSVSYVIPASKTVLGRNTISVSAMRGTGSACPLNVMWWDGRSGFWVSSRDEIDVTVGAPPGRCCATDGTCSVTIQAACTGVWTADGLCAPNPCVETTGPCCALDGSCTVTTQANCYSAVWTGAGVCTPNPCSQPATGSCCSAGGFCEVTTLEACAGAWISAGVCTPNPCPTEPPPDGMVWIPAGNVRLGQIGVAEPVHDFYVRSFYIDRFEVSNGRYKAFVDAGGYTTEAYWNPVGWAWRMANGILLPDDWNSSKHLGGGVAGNEQFPVSGVSWWEADAFCRWAGGRLPTEAEWEKAAKGGCEAHGDPGQCDASDVPSYPWGEGLWGQQANYRESGDPFENSPGTTPVGFYDGSVHDGYVTIDSPSPYGLYDVAGNVNEWCSTRYAAYPYDPNDGREDPPASDAEPYRVQRGG